MRKSICASTATSPRPVGESATSSGRCITKTTPLRPGPPTAGRVRAVAWTMRWWTNSHPTRLGLLADGDRYADAGDVGHCHLERLVQQAECLAVPGGIRHPIVAARIVSLGKQAGRGMIGDLDAESAARVGAAVTGSWVFSHVILLAPPVVGGHKAQD